MNELGSYVSHVLTEIINGVSDAQVKVDHLNAKVNPVGLSVTEGGTDITLKTTDANIASFVEFDINVVAESKTSGEGGFNLSILKLGANGRVSGEAKQADTHKVKFKVPVLFPAHGSSEVKHGSEND